MATGQTLLDTMEVLFPELNLQTGEGDVAKGLIALNRIQDLFETYAATYPDFKGDQVGTITTTASVEYTAFPTGLLRIDGLDFLDPVTLRPSYELDPLSKRGGHAHTSSWPHSLYYTSGSGGRPSAYWTNGTRIYWSPLPDAPHSVRWYGFSAASDITAVGTFAYDDQCILPFAMLAVKLIRVGLDDSVVELSDFGAETFNTLMEALSGFRRDGSGSYQYRYRHDT